MPELKKNIVFVIESLQLGGSEKSLVTLLQHLDNSKWNIDLIVFHKGGIFEKQVPEYVNIIFKPFPMLNLLERVAYKLKRVFQNQKVHSQQLIWTYVKSKLQKHEKEYDIAIAYSQGFATYFTATFIQAPIKYSWLNVDYVQANYQYNIDAKYYKSFQAIVCVSKVVQEGILSVMNKQTSQNIPTIVIPDIVDIASIKTLAQEQVSFPSMDKATQIVTVGRLKEEKGLLMAVLACKQLIDKGYDIVWSIVGEGTQRIELEKLIIQNI